MWETNASSFKQGNPDNGLAPQDHNVSEYSLRVDARRAASRQSEATQLSSELESLTLIYNLTKYYYMNKNRPILKDCYHFTQARITKHDNFPLNQN